MRRPLGITLLAFYYILAGVGGGLITWYLYTHADAPLNVVRLYYGAEFQSVQIALYSILTVLAVISVLLFVIGTGLFSMEPWAWTLSIISESGNLVLLAVSFIAIPIPSPVNVEAASGCTFMFHLAILIYLLSPGVREAFAG